MCVGRGREAVHVGRQLRGSDWFRGRGICSRTPRGECWGSGDVGLLWVPPLSICHRYNTAQETTTQFEFNVMYRSENVVLALF